MQRILAVATTVFLIAGCAANVPPDVVAPTVEIVPMLGNSEGDSPPVYRIRRGVNMHFPFAIKNHTGRTIRVALDPCDPTEKTLAFLDHQLIKNGHIVSRVRFPYVIGPGKEDVRDLRPNGQILHTVRLDRHYSKRLLEGEYELTLKYRLIPGSADATHQQNEIGVDPIDMEYRVSVIFE